MMERDIHIEAVDDEMNKTLQRDSELELEMLELFEDITLEEVVSNKACVGKVIGCKDMPTSVVKKILSGVWRRLGPWRMKKCEDGVMGFFFEEEEDCNFVMENRPWIVNGVILNLKPWPLEGEVRIAEFEFAEAFHRAWINVWLAHPIPAGFFLTADGKPESWIQFKYEKLPHLCFNCGKLAHWDKVCNAPTAMVFPSVGTAVPMYGIWIKSDTGTWKRKTVEPAPEINTTIGKGKGKTTQADKPVAPGKRSAYVAKKVQGATPTTMYQIDRGSTSGTKEFEKGGNVGDEGITDNTNVLNEVFNEVRLNFGPEVLALPRPDFAAVDDNNEMIPDIGPTIGQSLKVPHNWVCLS
uniref:CCHC-type domain-containing protein n=1 Tax=Cannabis sativa TaxID=3483 RepID=A0A803NJ16_CANSA